MFWFKLHRVAASVVRTACDKSSCDVDFDEKRTTQHGIRMMGGISNSTKKKISKRRLLFFCLALSSCLSCSILFVTSNHNGPQ